MKILVGSNNKHKLNEIQEIFDKELSFEVQFISPKDLSSEPFEIEETGATFLENSKIKAIEFFNHFQIPTIADDSGLIIDLLGGEPGTRSARYAGENTNDAANRKLVQLRLAAIGAKSSSARFVCVMTYYDGINLIQAEGICEGTIIDHEKGNNGFGYDPMFIPNGYTKTFAELESSIKNRISHRALAIKKLIEKLKQGIII